MARGPLGAVTVGLAAAVEVLGAVRAGVVLLFSNGEAGRGSAAGLTSRLGCSTFFSGLGFGLGWASA